MKNLNEVREIVTINNIREVDALSVISSDFLGLPAKLVHIVTDDEIGRPDLIAVREKVNIGNWWLVLLYNSIVDPFEINAGDNIKIPDLTYLPNILNKYRRINNR